MCRKENGEFSALGNACGGRVLVIQQQAVA